MCVDLVEKIEARRETALGLPIVSRPVVDVVIIDSLLLCVFIIVAKSSGHNGRLYPAKFSLIFVVKFSCFDDEIPDQIRSS